MFRRIKSYVGRTLANRKAAATGAIVTTGVVTTNASAGLGGGFTPADLGDIVFALDLASISTAVGTAGASMIGLWAIWAIGFKLVKKFIRRMGAVV